MAGKGWLVATLIRRIGEVGQVRFSKIEKVDMVLPIFWHVVISLEFEITPNSSTLEAKKMHVGANSNGSIHFNELRA